MTVIVKPNHAEWQMLRLCSCMFIIQALIHSKLGVMLGRVFLYMCEKAEHCFLNVLREYSPTNMNER